VGYAGFLQQAPKVRAETTMPSADKFLLAGVMGWPIMHSRSPLIHNHWV
jgi:hypothetical protein